MDAMKTRNVAIYIFDDVEVLDFAGPFEVFSVTRLADDTAPFNVYTVALESGPVKARNNLSINPRYTLDDCPKPDIVVVPGGYGTRQEMNNDAVLRWVKQSATECELLLSVCSGALILAKAGLLDGLRATTHRSAVEELQNASSEIVVTPKERFVDNGRIIVSAGVAAGIDMSFHVVARLFGEDVARATAEYIEYEWHPTGT